jgi:hypothetical protein
MSGEHAEWVILEPVHQAVDVLRQLNDDPGHLFGYAHGSRDYLTSAITTRLAAFHPARDILRGCSPSRLAVT